MAEMLIDGVKLDACMTAEANAIRAKTGGSTDLTFDFANNKGFADAIAAIPSGGGEVWELHTITDIVITSPTLPGTFLNAYIRECAQWCYFPTSESPAINSAARGFSFDINSTAYFPINLLGKTGSAAGNTAVTGDVPMPTQYQINDLSVSSTRQRGNVNTIPAGTYTLKFYGVARQEA